ncbi:MAG: putative toxin-antitoxin system toxin component, PIN family [Candidatus Acidiferrales bacterium]
MRLLLDTNVLIAAFITRGVCAELLEHVVEKHEPVGSSYVLAEFHDKLVKKFAISRREATAAAHLLASRFAMVEPVELGERVCRDADDDPVLATAVAGHCACLITGDRDLLSLKEFRGVVILSPQQFWKFEAEGPP